MRPLRLLMLLAGGLFAAVTASAQAPERNPEQASPGAIPPPPVEAGALAHSARPNFANTSALEAYLDGVIESFMAEDRIAGVTLSIVKDNTLLLAKGYGIAGQDPVRPVDPERTLFRIGSISKTFIWTAILQLADRNEINLDDRINLHLPSPLRLPPDDFETPILVRHLMSHTPGFEDSALGHLFVKDPKELTALDVYLERYRPERVREAGKFVAYSNYGAGLAGAIVEETIDQTFPAYVEQFIAAPLGMAHTTFREPIPEGLTIVGNLPGPMAPGLAGQLSEGFAVEHGDFAPQPFAYISHVGPAGAASSTATDMARYMRAWLNMGRLGEVRLVSREAAGRIYAAVRGDETEPPALADGFIEYTLPGGHRGFGHGGATLSFMSNMVMVPELNLGIFLSTNTDTGRRLVMRLPKLLVARYFAESRSDPAAASVKPDAQTGTQESTESTENLDRFAGSYLPLRRAYTTAEALFLAANAQAEIAVHPEGGLVLSGAGQSAQRYVRTGPLTFREAGGSDLLAFQEDENGRVIHFTHPLGITAFERVGVFARPAWFGIVLGLTGLGAVGALTGGWLRRKREIAQSQWEARAGKLMPALGGLWLLFIGLFAAAAVGMAQAGNEAIFTFPGGLLVTALAAGLLAGLASLAAAASLWPIWRMRSWPLWRRIRHSGFTLISLVMVLMLIHWNLIGFQYP